MTAVEIRRLSELALASGAVQPSRRGSLEGVCLVCGAHTREGLPPRLVFRPSFTEYNKLVRGGTVVCPVCAEMLSASEFRRRSWVMTLRGLRFLRRAEVYETIIEPPQPPFALYATTSGKKQGFIVLAPYVATSRDFYPVAWDSDLVWVDRARALRYHELITVLRGMGARKGELLGGCSPRTWAGARRECWLVERYRGDILWRLMVWAAP